VVTRANVATLFPWARDSRWPLPLSKPTGCQNGGKMPQKGGKMATFAGTCYVTCYGATPLLPCGCVNCRRIDRREPNSHNHLFLKSLRRKSVFPNFQKNPKNVANRSVSRMQSGPPFPGRQARSRVGR